MNTTHSASYAHLNKPEIWKYNENEGRVCVFFIFLTLCGREFESIQSQACAENIWGVNKEEFERMV